MQEIRIATSDEEIAGTFNVMRQLRTDITEAEYVPLVRKLQARGYLLAFLREEDQVVAVAGFRLTNSLAWGDFVYVDDLVCDEATRSRGSGRSLLSWIVDYARARGCGQLHLDSGVHRFDAHRFYLRERMDITCHHFFRNIA